MHSELTSATAFSIMPVERNFDDDEKAGAYLWNECSATAK